MIKGGEHPHIQKKGKTTMNNIDEGLARFHELMEANVESNTLSAEDLERGFDLFEGCADKPPPEALQRFADMMD